MTDITQLKRALVARVLDSNGMAPQELRRAAFDDAGLDEPMGTLIEKVVYHGDTVTEVLNYVQFSAQDLVATFRRKVQNARLKRAEANTFIANYVEGLAGYTYLEGEWE